MIKGIGLGEYAVIVNGRRIDTAYGDQWTALELEAEWQETLADDPAVADNLDRDFEELYEDDGYWKNGHVAPLRLNEDEPIPFEGEPAGGDDEYGLEARG